METVASAMLRHPTEAALQTASCATLSNILRFRAATDPPLGAFWTEALCATAAAMSNFPSDIALQARASGLLWALATEDPLRLAARPGLRGLAEHAAGLGVREARLLLECVAWSARDEASVSTGGGRRRWGQWATGRRVAA
mmetsp:Transcript_178044/g.565120  ORF Transcript_178044/g.565120 Transcript_178044/m.565120 type:complete len:141 (-) Transcript_178044:13-435(-)